jgi:rSAM/selenodomain-associated transferase 2/rSAM/selenodomain-associated transferase 1
MNRPRRTRTDLIIVFGRYPVPGRTKTRLTPPLGPAGAAELQRVLTEKTVRTAGKAALHLAADLEIRFEGASIGRMRRWLGPGLSFFPQGTGDLGARMEKAFLKAFQREYRRVVLVGTDIPGLTPRLLEQAFHSLNTHDLVLGPSTDGGYWLMGLKRPAPLFEDIPWGSGTVLEDTLALAEKEDLPVRRLDPLTDVDTPGDLQAWMPEGAEPGPFVSVIIPALNEEANIGAAVQGARDRDAEVIVVDGASDDETVLRAQEAGARVIMSPRGRAVQQNRGAAAAKGNVLLFLHADTRLPEGYISHVFETLMDPRIVLGAFRFRIDLNRPLIRVIEILTNFRSRFLRLPYGDQGLFMRRTLFHSLGGFPEVPIAEDLFLVRRVAKTGPIGIAPASALTSARRWETLGPIRATLLNQLMLAGFLLRIPLPTLASLYRRQHKCQ